MADVFNKYYIYHVFPHSLLKVRLFNDNEDKLAFLEIISNTCLELDFRLFAFDVMTNHSHFMIGLKWFSYAKPTADWLEQKISNCVWNINRRYGKHYRDKYHYTGRIFQKNKDNFKPVIHNTDFLNKLKYIHKNACATGRYQVFEDNAFTSYNFYTAAFVHNPEFQNMPIIKRITTSLTFLPIFNALDLDYSINQYDNYKTFSNCVLEFISAHRNALLERDIYSHNTISTDRYKTLKMDVLLNNPSLFQISNTKGHKVKRFIDGLLHCEINNENFEEYFCSFSAFFPWHDKSLQQVFVTASQPVTAKVTSSIISNVTEHASNLTSNHLTSHLTEHASNIVPCQSNRIILKESFSLIRKHYKVEFDSFILVTAKKISANKISKVTGLSRGAIKKMLGD